MLCHSFRERSTCWMLWLSVSSNGFILLAEDPLLGLNTNGHDSVQEQSLFMDVDIWISYHIPVSGDIFLFLIFFSPVMKICSDHRKLQLGKTCRFGPRAVIGAYPNSCWNPTHCCVSSGIVPLLACACFLLNERGPWAFSQSPESPVYNRCLLNGVQMNGVAIIPLAAWRCLHETFWKWLSLS